MRRTVALLAIAVALTAGCTELTDKSSGEGKASAMTQVGETAHTGSFDVTLHTVKDPWTSTNMYEVPEANSRYVAVELEVTNTDSQTDRFSIFRTELMDQLNRPWAVAFAGAELPHLSGEIQPNGARRGWVVFELPNDATDLQLRIKGTGSVFQL